MSDHDALVAAICAAPDEDTPRLALADWLDENDQPERAEFIRAQIELARTPAWEPFAVFCRWRRPDWFTGKPFRYTLPPVNGFGLEWPTHSFHRGLGYRLNVRSLLTWEQHVPAILGRVPLGELSLWTATLDQWRSFVASPVIPHLRRVRFMTNPIEPMRVLRDTPAALGITDLHFERASGAGMAFVIEDLMRSPLGCTIRGLHFRVGYESPDEMIDAINCGQPQLKRLSFALMGLTVDHISRLCAGPVVRQLREFELRDNRLENDGLWFCLSQAQPVFEVLAVPGGGPLGRGFEAFLSDPVTTHLRRLDLSRNTLTARAARALSRSRHLAGLRSLSASCCGIEQRELYHLTRAKFWPNLVELDLRDNPITTTGLRPLLDAPVPPDLTALVLTGDRFGFDSRNELRKKYGERVVFAPSEPEA